MTTSARTLAVRLAALNDGQLTSLFRAREVRDDAPWTDFFDAAEWLLSAGAIDRALDALTSEEAIDLRRAADGSSAGASQKRLSDLALLDENARPLPAVAESVQARPAVHSTPEMAPPAATDSDSAHTAETAAATVRAVADLILAARHMPLSLIASGALTAGERRRLAESGIDEEVADHIRAIAITAELAQTDGRVLVLTSAADTWLALSFAERWEALNESFRRGLPRGLRAGDGWIPATNWPSAYPWDTHWPGRAKELLRHAELLGLLTTRGTEPAWARTLREGAPVDTATLTALLPPEVDRVFLQNDLTAIAPGPLHPALDSRLRTMTAHDTAQASSYRFTADTLAAALAIGETEQSITTFLTELSLTGVPQPLSYLLTQTAARHGLVRVTPEDGGTRVASVDTALLATIEVDRSLRPLALRRDGDTLVTRVQADAVAAALRDSRYPATMTDAAGTPASIAHPRLTAGDTTTSADYATLIARLREHHAADSDAAWLDRELEAAVSARAVVHVEVAMPDGSHRELVLEASGLGGGRLRGRDRAADVERTLPVRSIRSVRVVTD